MSARPPDAELSRRIGHVFADPGLLDVALTHASAAFERDGSRGNERLEFLGDAVLGLVVARLLYERHPDWREGDLTRARAALVNGRVLAHQARRLGLVEYFVLGRTERRSGGAEKDRMLANLFEAVIGAVYLDGGVEPVRALVLRCFDEALAADTMPARDPKTRFQEWAHATLRATPRYAVLKDSGVDDADDRFTVEVSVNEEPWGSGSGRSKRIAERAAAAQALERIEAGAGG